MKSPETETVEATENARLVPATSKNSPRLPLLLNVSSVPVLSEITSGVDERLATEVLPLPRPRSTLNAMEPLFMSRPATENDAAPLAPIAPDASTQPRVSIWLTGLNRATPKSTSVNDRPKLSAGLPNWALISRPPILTVETLTVLASFSVRVRGVVSSTKVNEPPSLKELPRSMLPVRVTEVGA